MLIRIPLATLGVCLLVGSTGLGQDWAKEMFPVTSHDFGGIARGAKAEFAFTFENIYLEDVKIRSVRSSCGCTSTKFPTQAIKTYEKGQIVATIDTRTFMGAKNATLTVELEKPFLAELSLQVHCYIRSDVVFQPGAIEFGSIQQGQGAKQKTTVSYAGRGDWAVTGVKSPSPYLATQLVEAARSAGRVTYDLVVELKPDAPPGYLGGQIILQTNDTDPQKMEVPLWVEGVVVPSLTVRPGAITFLASSDEKSLSRNLVVQGHKPFRIVEVACPDKRFSCSVPAEQRAFHILRVMFSPGATIGKSTTTIQIKTDQPGSPELKVDVQAEVVGEH